MNRDLPSLNAVRMFEAAARHQNFTRAAEALFVTQGAVSRQVKLLEDELKCDLFTRDGPRLTLTESGARFYAAVSDGLGAIRRGTLEIRRENAAPSLTISVLPSFAAKWLVQRVADFQQHNRDVEIRIIASYDAVDFTTRADIDAAIRWGQGDWPSIYSECLLTEQLFPVCSPGFVLQHDSPEAAADIARLPLIRPLEKYDQWDDWFATAGVEGPRPGNVPRYSDALLLQKAAIEGQGIALARSLIVEDDLESGRLVRLTGPSIPCRWSFYFVCPPALRSNASVDRFLEWLRSEVSRSADAC